MTDKPDYYAVLGIAKTATAEDVNKAHQKKVMKYHPDRMINKTDAEKAEAQKQFQLCTEAYEVLNNPQKRKTYDSYGHAGLASLAAGHSAQTGTSYTDLERPTEKPKPVSEEDAFNFFQRRRDAAGPVTNAGTGDADVLDDDAARDARRRAREERRNRGTGAFAEDVVVKPPARPPEPPTRQPPPVFNPAPAPKTPAKDGLDDVRRDADRLRDELARANAAGIPVPLEALENFRAALAEMLTVVDKAIVQAKKDGPKPR